MKIRFFFWLVFFLTISASAKTVHYDLLATKTPVNLSGKKTVDFAIQINGGIPAPTLEFVEGDEAEIVVKNEIADEPLSLHWHGILLPWAMDGVPYLTTPSIPPGGSFTFRFTLRQSGTYWYHSHTGVQEQKGVYGAFIVHPKKVQKFDHELVLVFSDWSDENPERILRNLRKDGDYYLSKKGTTRSWWGALQQGKLSTFLYNEWTRMGGMDFSDVGYDAFLINGQREIQWPKLKAGEKVRLRLINAASSTYFYVSLADLPMPVISADGVDINPLSSHELLMAMAETYDIAFTMPENKSYELKISAQDGTGSASAWLGSGDKIPANERAKPELYASMDHASHQGHQHHLSEQALTVDQLQALQPTEFSPELTREEIKLVLGGDMSRYIWTINGKTVQQEPTLSIQPGEVIRLVLENQTMMHHPIHLHGHFFRVLNAYEKNSPLKHTVDVPPHQTRIIEFLASESGVWMLHCHNIYHMKTGMARVVTYADFVPSQETIEMQKHDPHKHEHLYYDGYLEAASNHAQGFLRLSQTWDTLEARFESRKDFSWKGEGDVFYRHWFSPYFNIILGGTAFEGDEAAVAGIGYKLPFLLESKVLLDHRGRYRLDLDKRFQWTRTIYSQLDLSFREDEKTEWEMTLMYSPQWAWSAGLMFTEDSTGIGAQFRF